MDTKINDFCNAYTESLKPQKEDDVFSRNHYFFYVTLSRRMTFMGYDQHLILLDADDLKYLYNKYSAKLKEELDANIEHVKSLYNKNNNG